MKRSTKETTTETNFLSHSDILFFAIAGGVIVTLFCYSGYQFYLFQNLQQENRKIIAKIVKYETSETKIIAKKKDLQYNIDETVTKIEQAKQEQTQIINSITTAKKELQDYQKKIAAIE